MAASRFPFCSAWYFPSGVDGSLLPEGLEFSSSRAFLKLKKKKLQPRLKQGQRSKLTRPSTPIMSFQVVQIPQVLIESSTTNTAQSFLFFLSVWVAKSKQTLNCKVRANRQLLGRKRRKCIIDRLSASFQTTANKFMWTSSSQLADRPRGPC